MKTIWFDMDGTIADLFKTENWLERLRAEDVTPYVEASPMVHLPTFCRECRQLQKLGYGIGIISWTSMKGSPKYNEEVASAKVKWLTKHLPSLQFDQIIICEYGTPKTNFATSVDDILFDDTLDNRLEWRDEGMIALSEKSIIKTLSYFIKKEKGIAP